MGEDKPQTTEQTQRSESSPWSAAQPLLQKLIDSYGGMSTAVTPAQKAATDRLTADTTGMPNFGAASAGGLDKAFNFSTAPQVGMLGDTLNTLKGNLSPIASGSQLNPWETPGFSDAINTMSSDITKRVGNVYAGSGRDPSGAGSFAKSLGRGLTEGIAPVIASQYNTNAGRMDDANKTLFNAGGSTASGEANLGMLPINTALAGVNAVPGAATAYSAPGATQLGAANTAYSTPWTNLAQLLAPATTLGSMGGTTVGSGTSTTTPANSMLSNIIGGGSAGIGMLSMLMSDERVKEGIREVGKLHDGQPIMSYRYKGQPETHIGLLAQETIKSKPHAVGHMGMGLLGIDYEKATDESARMAA